MLLPIQEAIMTEYEREPTLEDVLADPLVHALMARDRVDAEEVRALLERLRSAEKRRPPGGRSIGLRHSRRGVIDA